MINDYSERHYSFEGCFNFRDIGGYLNQDGRRVKKGLYFRAGRQDRMTNKDLAQLSDLNISTQIDLRKKEEVLDQGRGPLEDMGAKYINISVIPEGGSEKLNKLVGDTGISGKRYLGYLEFGPTSWLRLFGILADEENLPVLLHCTAGKDRTGVSTAFLLSVLGVSRDIIEADYLLTNLDTERQADFIESTVGYPEGYNREKMISIAGVPKDAMKDFLDGVESKWGSVIEYLEKIGVTQEQMDQVRLNFLE
jgi:protein tyrosine/serine phosphatase|tara:strand:- start:1 stop:753 length:753 start_codon:yes stop_codon:yes gene_type:complete